jgi:xylulokinase
LAEKGLYAYEADILATGSAVKWLSNILTGGDIDKMIGMAKDAPPGSKGLAFYPYISGGEQSVVWDPLLCGGIRGLTENHVAGDIVRALLEGLCYEVRRCLDAFSENGFIAGKIYISGHLVSNPFFANLLADILGMPCIEIVSKDSSALGAALLGGIGADLWDESTASSIAISLTESGKVYRPSDEAHLLYEDHYKSYIQNTDTMRQISD